MVSKKLQSTSKSVYFPPVVAVLGHVDHGKTTLLDAIRKTSIAEREHGGITQRVGASSIELMHDKVRRRITFIDTPGHEAFASMRSRGAIASDIGLLIVSATDGVMPQTKESIALLKASNVPFIVVITKIDLETANEEKVKQQLLKEEVLLEGFGGDVPVIGVSAKTNKNVQELLELILLVQEVHASHEKEKPSSSAPLMAVVIESKRDPASGPKATVVIKNGSLSLRDDIVDDDHHEAKVRTILAPDGSQVKTATVGDAVEVLGFSQPPAVGTKIMAKSAKSSAKPEVAATEPALFKELVYQRVEATHALSIVLIADTEGSLEAITQALPKGIVIVSKKTGEPTEGDILMAKSTGSIMISFNSRLRPQIVNLASSEKVLAKNYTIIYELLAELGDVVEGRQRAIVEEIYGQAKVLGRFPFEKTFVAGIKVLEGRVARGDKVRIQRGEEVVGEGTITSLRVGKEPQSKVEKGREAGIIATPLLDFQVGDMVICHD